MSDAHCLVVGGGFAGVAAAAQLRARAASVTLLDERATLGGRARSDELEGTTLDLGVQLISTAFTRTLALLDADGSGAGLRRALARDLVGRGGTRHAIQFGSLPSLLRFSGLSATEKVKLARHLLPALALHRAHLDADGERIPESLDRQSARGYVAMHVGPGAADVLVEPPLNAFYAARATDVSLAFFLVLARYAADSAMLAPAAGWSAALRRALRGAAHEPEVRVIALEAPRAGGVVARAEDGRAWHADGVVLATDPRAAAALLEPLAPAAELLSWLRATAVRPALMVAAATTAALPRDAFGIFADPTEARLVSACAVEGARVREDAPTDRDVLLVWPTPRAVDELIDRASEDVVAALLPEALALVPEARGRISRARVYRWAPGTPLAHPGFAADRARGRALAQRLAMPIALAGDYLTAPLVEGAVASGEAAARQLLTALGSR